jgi:hypothetical protein
LLAIAANDDQLKTVRTLGQAIFDWHPGIGAFNRHVELKQGHGFTVTAFISASGLGLAAE